MADPLRAEDPFCGNADPARAEVDEFKLEPGWN